jgi:hypothetical protein
MYRCPCHCWDGFVALVTMASSLLIYDGIVALIAMVLLSSSSWHCCPCCNGIVVIINVVALVACHQAGIVAIDAQASSPLSWWQLSLLSWWQRCHCWCPGISGVAKLAPLPSLFVVKLALLPLSWWHCCHWYAGVFAVVVIAIVALMTMALLPLLMCRRPCHCWDGVIPLVTMAASPMIHTSVVALIMTRLMPSSSWRSCPCHNGVTVIINVITLVARFQAGIVAVNAQASLLLSEWQLLLCHNGIVAIVNVQASLPFSS